MLTENLDSFRTQIRALLSSNIIRAVKLMQGVEAPTLTLKSAKISQLCVKTVETA
jgi:hypothetical protein